MVRARLRTRRLLLVPLAEDHIEHEIDLDSDPEVMRYLGNGKPATREQVVQAHQERLAVGDLVPGWDSGPASMDRSSWACGSSSHLLALTRARSRARPNSAPAPAPALASGACQRGRPRAAQAWVRRPEVVADLRRDHGRQRRLPRDDGGNRHAARPHLRKGLRRAPPWRRAWRGGVRDHPETVVRAGLEPC
jgi:hypothetical protein